MRLSPNGVPLTVKEPEPPLTFSMPVTPPVPVAVPLVRFDVAAGKDLTADGAAWERGGVDIEVGDAAQESRLVECAQRNARGIEGEAASGGNQARGAEIDDDRSVDPDGRAMDVETGDVAHREVVHGDADIEGLGDDVVVSKRGRAGGGAGRGRIFLVGAKGGGKAGRPQPQVHGQGAGVGSVVEEIRIAASIDRAAAHSGAVPEREGVVAGAAIKIGEDRG